MKTYTKDREPKTKLQKEFGRDFINSEGYFSTSYVEWLEEKNAQFSNVTDEDALEPIQNALYATNAFSQDDCTGLAEGVLMYLKDAGFSLIKSSPVEKVRSNIVTLTDENSEAFNKLA